MDIGNRIRQRRKAKGLSQEKLAREAGVTLSLISKIENGRIHDLHYSTLSGCAAALEMSVAQLIGEEPAPHESARDEALQRLKDYIKTEGLAYRFTDSAHEDVPGLSLEILGGEAARQVLNELASGSVRVNTGVTIQRGRGAYPVYIEFRPA